MNTKQIIIEALKTLLEKQRFEKITVQDILNQAHCSRGTFYRHFKDKYEVMTYYYYETYQPILFNRELHGRERIRVIIEILLKNAPYFTGVMDTEGVNSFQQFVKTYSSQFFLDIYRNNAGPESIVSDRVAFMADFLSGGYASVIKEWIICRNALSVDELVDCLYALTPKEFL